MGSCRHCTDTVSFICADFVPCCYLTICSFFLFSTLKELRRLVIIRETLILIQNSNSIERETGKGRSDSPIRAVLRTGSTCAQRGDFTEVWEPAVTACGCDTSPTNSAALFSRRRNTGSDCHIKAYCEDPCDGLGDTF